MATKQQKTWSQLTKELSQLMIRWPAVVTYNLENDSPPRQHGKAWQTKEHREVRLEMKMYRGDQPGVATVTLAVSKWNNACENLAAVIKTLEELRLFDVRDHAKIAAVVLRQRFPATAPAAAPPPPPRTIPAHYAALHLQPDAPLEVAEAAYRALARRHHPDAGGDTVTMQRLNAAIELIREEKRGL